MLGRLVARFRLRPVLAVVLLSPLLVLTTPAASTAYDVPVEEYSSYQAPRKCVARVKPGSRALAGWIDRKYTAGGRALPSLRACPSTGASSEHHEGRAIDWMMDATRKKERREVKRFLQRIFAEDRQGNRHALARRMGVMYVIWDDRFYASYSRFEARDYRSSSCKKLRKCSATLRHRDHVHISLSRKGAKARTSWYTARR